MSRFGFFGAGSESARDAQRLRDPRPEQSADDHHEMATGDEAKNRGRSLGKSMVCAGMVAAALWLVSTCTGEPARKSPHEPVKAASLVGHESDAQVADAPSAGRAPDAEPDATLALTTKPERCAATREPDDLLVLVNKESGLPVDYRPRAMRRVPTKLMIPGRSGLLRREAVEAYAQMAAAVYRRLRRRVRIRSAYRSYKEQNYTFKDRVKKLGQRRAVRLSAKPGHSQHQLGTTVDVSTKKFGWKLTQRLGSSAVGRWLAKNAHEYGFVVSYPRNGEAVTGYAYEPWHLRFIGKQAAQELHERGALLETYLQRCAACDPELRCPRP